MKMNRKDYLELEAAIKAVIKVIPGARDNYREQGLSDMRYRWDLFWASKMDGRVFYDHGLNDDHIDTALRKITGTK